jgi:hypothetical protein
MKNETKTTVTMPIPTETEVRETVIKAKPRRGIHREYTNPILEAARLECLAIMAKARAMVEPDKIVKREAKNAITLAKAEKFAMRANAKLAKIQGIRS